MFDPFGWFRTRVEAPYRRERAKWKVALRWTTGCVTDPHTKWSSAARIVGVGTAVSMWAYTSLAVLTSQKPDPYVVGALVTLITAALALRAKSTQEGKVPPAVRRADLVTAPALPGDPDLASAAGAAADANVGARPATLAAFTGLAAVAELISRRRDPDAGVEAAP